MTADDQKKQQSSVKVCLRVRPMLAKEYKEHANPCVQASEDEKSVIIGDHRYSFDHVFGESSSQQQVFSETVSLLDSFLSGYNGTIFAYGQTGSGKTYTMAQAPQVDDTDSHLGIIPRAVEYIFKSEVTRRPSTRISVSYIEIYMEGLRDLLKPNQRSSHPHSKEHLPGTIIKHVKNAAKKVVESYDEIMTLFRTFGEYRASGSTLMNEQSSRSHAIFTINLQQEIRPGRYVASKLHLVDLAGSESQKKAGTDGKRLGEAININLGLLALGNVINALHRGDSYIPYRDSQLTSVLRDSLGGNSLTTMVACVSSADTNFSEIFSTVTYARRARLVVNKPCKIEEKNRDLYIEDLKARIEALKEQLDEARNRPTARERAASVDQAVGRDDPADDEEESRRVEASNRARSTTPAGTRRRMQLPKPATPLLNPSAAPPRLDLHSAPPGQGSESSSNDANKSDNRTSRPPSSRAEPDALELEQMDMVLIDEDADATLTPREDLGEGRGLGIRSPRFDPSDSESDAYDDEESEEDEVQAPMLVETKNDEASTPAAKPSTPAPINIPATAAAVDDELVIRSPVFDPSDTTETSDDESGFESDRVFEKKESPVTADNAEPATKPQPSTPPRSARPASSPAHTPTRGTPASMRPSTPQGASLGQLVAEGVNQRPSTAAGRPTTRVEPDPSQFAFFKGGSARPNGNGIRRSITASRPVTAAPRSQPLVPPRPEPTTTATPASEKADGRFTVEEIGELIRADEVVAHIERESRRLTELQHRHEQLCRELKDAETVSLNRSSVLQPKYAELLQTVATMESSIQVTAEKLKKNRCDTDVQEKFKALLNDYNRMRSEARMIERTAVEEVQPQQRTVALLRDELERIEQEMKFRADTLDSLRKKQAAVKSMGQYLLDIDNIKLMDPGEIRSMWNQLIRVGSGYRKEINTLELKLREAENDRDNATRRIYEFQTVLTITQSSAKSRLKEAEAALNSEREKQEALTERLREAESERERAEGANSRLSQEKEILQGVLRKYRQILTDNGIDPNGRHRRTPPMVRRKLTAEEVIQRAGK
ncbi:Kinesin motor domain [Carpediemonas membranifera]|uniref:Kinesin motor domain n=1 Tax=Carpediemonas membranifera TaxID=201153 RepID=A0A8J6B483_9EUKA|nr:Kinesin motor domain [Carpediemonas membranifera]|eukprot:KAG9392654.1 Kinesin motor domain [Carpediemonas membranifera]